MHKGCVSIISHLPMIDTILTQIYLGGVQRLRVETLAHFFSQILHCSGGCLRLPSRSGDSHHTCNCQSPYLQISLYKFKIILTLTPFQLTLYTCNCQVWVFFMLG
jgi:hypothetical protein